MTGSTWLRSSPVKTPLDRNLRVTRDPWALSHSCYPLLRVPHGLSLPTPPPWPGCPSPWPGEGTARLQPRASATSPWPPGVGRGRLTVASRLAVLRGEVDALAHAAAGVRHDAQPTGEDGGHHGHVGAVPQQPAVAQRGVGLEPVSLRWGVRNRRAVPTGSGVRLRPGSPWAHTLMHTPTSQARWRRVTVAKTVQSGTPKPGHHLPGQGRAGEGFGAPSPPRLGSLSKHAVASGPWGCRRSASCRCGSPGGERERGAKGQRHG